MHGERLAARSPTRAPATSVAATSSTPCSSVLQSRCCSSPAASGFTHLHQHLDAHRQLAERLYEREGVLVRPGQEAETQQRAGTVTPAGSSHMR